MPTKEDKSTNQLHLWWVYFNLYQDPAWVLGRLDLLGGGSSKSKRACVRQKPKNEGSSIVTKSKRKLWNIGKTLWALSDDLCSYGILKILCVYWSDLGLLTSMFYPIYFKYPYSISTLNYKYRI